MKNKIATHTFMLLHLNYKLLCVTCLFLLQQALPLSVSLSEPEEAPTGVATTVMNSTVRVKWNEAQNVRGLLLGYKVPVPLQPRRLVSLVLLVRYWQKNLVESSAVSRGRGGDSVTHLAHNSSTTRPGSKTPLNYSVQSNSIGDFIQCSPSLVQNIFGFPKIGCQIKFLLRWFLTFWSFNITIGHIVHLQSHLVNSSYTLTERWRYINKVDSNGYKT